MKIARRVFTGGDILWKKPDHWMNIAVDLSHSCVGDLGDMHRADVRSLDSCGRWWIDTGRPNVQKSVANDCRPQSTRLLSPLPNPILNTKEMWNDEISM